MPGHVIPRGKREDGSTIWRARWTHPLDARQKIDKRFRTKALAQRWLAKVEAEANAGAFRREAPEAVTFAEVVGEWRRTRLAQHAPSSVARYEQVLRTYLLPEFGERDVTELRGRELRLYLADLAATGKKPGTVKKVHTVLSSVLDEAVKLDRLAVNPAHGMGLPEGSPREQIVLEADEIRALADAVPPAHRALVLTAATTGMRAGELYALRRRDLEMAAGKLHVRRALKKVGGRDAPPDADLFGLPKTGKTRTLDLPSALRPVLAAHLLTVGGGADALVFPGPQGRPICHTAFVRNHFRPAVTRALPAEKRALRFHDLRHTCVSLLLASGYSMHEAARYVGHSSIATTDRYTHMLPSRDDSLAAARDAAFGAALEPVAEVVPLRAAEG